jgi:hypothetical protein
MKQSASRREVDEIFEGSLAINIPQKRKPSASSVATPGSFEEIQRNPSDQFEDGELISKPVKKKKKALQVEVQYSSDFEGNSALARDMLAPHFGQPEVCYFG